MNMIKKTISLISCKGGITKIIYYNLTLYMRALSSENLCRLMPIPFAQLSSICALCCPFH